MTKNFWLEWLIIGLSAFAGGYHLGQKQKPAPSPAGVSVDICASAIRQAYRAGVEAARP